MHKHLIQGNDHEEFSYTKQFFNYNSLHSNSVFFMSFSIDPIYFDPQIFT